MNIEEVCERIERQIIQGCFSLSAGTVGLESMGRLCAVFGLDVLALHGTSCRECLRCPLLIQICR